MKINTPKFDKILKVEINLSVLKFMYLGQIASDLNKCGFKVYVKVFSIEIKRKFDNYTKGFCYVVNQTFLVSFFWRGGGHMAAFLLVGHLL